MFINNLANLNDTNSEIKFIQTIVGCNNIAGLF